MTQQKAQQIVKEDDDYDEDGILKSDIKEEYKEKFSDDEFDDLGIDPEGGDELD